jgi:hypothetical protein
VRCCFNKKHYNVCVHDFTRRRIFERPAYFCYRDLKSSPSQPLYMKPADIEASGIVSRGLCTVVERLHSQVRIRSEYFASLVRLLLRHKKMDVNDVASRPRSFKITSFVRYGDLCCSDWRSVTVNAISNDVASFNPARRLRCTGASNTPDLIQLVSCTCLAR